MTSPVITSVALDRVALASRFKVESLRTGMHAKAAPSGWFVRRLAFYCRLVGTAWPRVRSLLPRSVEILADLIQDLCAVLAHRLCLVRRGDWSLL